VPGTRKALAMTTDCNGRYVYLDPYVGGQIAVAEAARNIVASGGLPLAVTDNLNFGSPENPEIFWQMDRAVEGISEACLALNTPVIGGNVSMYNERSGMAIYPTPTIGIVGLIEDIDHITTQTFKAAGDRIYLVGQLDAPQYGGSELQKLQTGTISGKPPAIDLEQEAKVQVAVLSAIRAGYIQSAHDISEGGIAVALAECLMDTDLGAEIVNIPCEFLFAENQSLFIVSVSPENAAAFETLVGASFIGVVNDTARLKIACCDDNPIDLPVPQMRDAWKGAIPCLLK